MVNTKSAEQIVQVREQWAGRRFTCTATGDIVTIPDTVMPGDFFWVGESYIDVGDGMYSRGGGVTLKEITDEAQTD